MRRSARALLVEEDAHGVRGPAMSPKAPSTIFGGW